MTSVVKPPSKTKPPRRQDAATAKRFGDAVIALVRAAHPGTFIEEGER